MSDVPHVPHHEYFATDDPAVLGVEAEVRANESISRFREDEYAHERMTGQHVEATDDEINRSFDAYR